jgi:hypothetical protein
MSLSLNGIINTDFKGLLKALKALLVLSSPNSSPSLRPNKSGIFKKIPDRTLEISKVPKDQGNNDYLNPKAL